MEVKQILKKIRQPKEEKRECFFALQIGPELVKSAVWEVEAGQVKILSLGKSEEWQDEETIFEAIDATLSSATENLTVTEEFQEPNKAVLGLSPDWVKENKIIPDKLQILKKIAKDLELVFTGFVVSNEAVVYQLKSTEGIPATAILVHLGKSKLQVSLINLGKIVGSELVDKSGDLGADLIEGLSRIKTEGVFPARILIYGDEEKLEEARQELVSYPWQESHQPTDQPGAIFLHLPKVEILNSDFEIKAVALAGGREMVGAVKIDESQINEPKGLNEQTEVEEAIPAEKPGMFGFVKGEDIQEKLASTAEPKPEIISESVEPERKSRLLRLKIPRLTFGWLRNINLGFFTRFRTKITGLLPSRIPKMASLVLILLLLLIGGLVALYWFWPKAEVIIFVKPQLLEKNFTVRLDPELATPDRENLVLPAEKIEVILEDEKIGGVTGTKLIGDPAKGEVTIYNGTGQEKTFNSDAVIKTASGIEFTLDEQVTVASQSGTAADPTSGKAKVGVTAVKIGTEGNLASGTDFTIANFSQSDYVAKNESSFSGGTSREVQVVTKEDQQKLVTDLTKGLKDKALVSLSEKVSLNKKLIEDSLTDEVVEQNYDRKVGEEATEVKLAFKIKFSALSFAESEFRDLIQEEIQASVPEGFEYQAEESEIDFELDEVTDKDTALFSAHFKARLIPIIDLEQIKKNLTGKQVAIARIYLGNLPNVDSFQATVKPRLPDKLATFPRVTSHIKIEKRLK